MDKIAYYKNFQEFNYKAVRIRQTNTGDYLVLFAASAIEVEMWAGVPQKKKIGDQETTGFQREENKKRINDIKTFYKNEKNIIQNPLLCALRHPGQVNIKFEAFESNTDDTIQHGWLKIYSESLENLSLLELLKRVKNDLETRVPELANKQIPDHIIRNLKQHSDFPTEYLEVINNDAEEDENSKQEDDIGSSLTDESHIVEFWEEVASYYSVLEELNFNGDRFVAYSKQTLIDFLRPVVVVDGQHRLRAAIASAKGLVRESPYKERLEEAILDCDMEAEEAQRKIEAEAARQLPVSLLMNTDPAEHVFQFVVVNQKATPIKTALLGTIVSTSLSNQELERVSDRLELAGIKLEESRAVTFLARNTRSPFYNLVERGLTSDTKDRLKWNVLGSIVKIFWELKGGKLFHESVDYADKWRRSYLEKSEIVSGWQDSESCENEFEYWHRLDGVWREVFIVFWTSVRKKLSDLKNDQAWHYWGNPKKSNIFNHTSLTILSADFFQYLCERKLGIDNVKQIPTLVNEWLEDVNPDYFNRDWNLHGVKKDVPGIRKRWSKLWVEYRKDPQRLPKATLYRDPLGN